MNCLNDITLKKIEGKKSEFIHDSKLLIFPNYKQKNGIDGLAHINHVLSIGEELSKYYCTDFQYDIILGCLLHDIGRGYEINNQTHGGAGESISREILNMYYNSECFDFEKIIYAVKNHDKGLVTPDITIGSIWDADRLSLYRFKNRVINEKLLSTERAKDILDFAKEYIYDNIDDYNIDYSNMYQANTLIRTRV